MDKKILDVTCGSRSIWFDKHHPAAVYCDERQGEYHLDTEKGNHKTLIVEPDVERPWRYDGLTVGRKGRRA